MTRQSTSAISVARLLEQQREALLRGDLLALSALPPRLEDAMRRLAVDQTDPATLAALAQTAAHNARLVLSARAGLARAGRDCTPKASLTTYDAQGRTAVGTAQGQLIARR